MNVSARECSNRKEIYFIHLFIHSSIQSLDNYLLNCYYVPDSQLGAEIGKQTDGWLRKLDTKQVNT